MAESADQVSLNSAPQLDDADLRARLAALSLEQKVRLLTGADFWALHPEPAAGLRRLVVSDGPAGVRGELWDERDTSVNIPSPTALAASWDVDAVERLGGLLAVESRRKGVDVLLAPTVNLHRTPYGGRHFECLSEDPTLTGRIGAAFVRGVQRGGVGACVKHFVANDSETQRMTLDVSVDDRVLRELYLAPFEEIVRDAGVWSVMAAYNGVNGHPMTENPLLREVLQAEWGFDGVTMSDWFATRSTAATGNAALDLAMPGPASPWGDALVAAVRAGDVDAASIDDKVLRILGLAARVGALDGVPGVATAPAVTDAEAATLVRTQAAAGFVLARNDAVLPVNPHELRKVAVIGPNAEVGRTLGGGSATVYPPYTVSPADGIRRALGDAVAVDVALGVRSSLRSAPARAPYAWRPDGTPGVEVRLVAEDGTILATEARSGGVFNWLAGINLERPVARIEVHSLVRAVNAGEYEIGGSGIGRFRLSVAGAEVFDAMLDLPPGADVVEAIMKPPQAVHHVPLDAGQEVPVVLVHDIGSGAAGGIEIGPIVQFVLEPPIGTDDQEIEHAVALAQAADLAVVVVGTTEEVESEGFDRESLALPGRQDELVRRVAAVNPRTVVVVNSGAPVLLPWAEEVGAVILAWFPGQEFGNALADVLLGAVEPGGRLPVTWPSGEEGLPATQPVDGQLEYTEGLHIGYRWYERVGREPLYRFGHGLGYTTWDYLGIAVPSTKPGEPVDVRVRIRNVGHRRGREVVQLYASRPGSLIERPAKWLVGFALADAGSGDEVQLTIRVPARAFEHWDPQVAGWSLERGTFVVHAGASSGDLRLQAELAL